MLEKGRERKREKGGRLYNAEFLVARYSIFI